MQGCPPSEVFLLHSDAHLAVFFKPSGMLVHRGMGTDDYTLMDHARELFGRRVHPVHRLDRGTSGVLVVALDPAIAATLQEAWTSGSVQKTYLALVRGTPPDGGVIDHPVPRGEGAARVDAVTAFRRVRTSPADRISLVEAYPRTGRFHQVRRHLKHLNHPVLGDANYGDNKFNRGVRERHGLARLGLHCWKVQLAHPVTGARLELVADLPEDLTAPMRSMGLEVPAS